MIVVNFLEMGTIYSVSRPKYCCKCLLLFGDEPDFIVSVEESEWTVITGSVGELSVVFTGVPDRLTELNGLFNPLLNVSNISTKRPKKICRHMKNFKM